MEYDGTHYLYRKNLFGDITAIYDRDTCVAKYAYDAYGVCKVMNPDGTENTDDDFIGNVNPIRYSGYYYDVGTGFYYLQTRYYDPQIGRFLNMDGLEYLDPETVGGLNLYAYCNCNPVMYVDPDGTAWWHWGLLAISVIGAIALVTLVDLASFGVGGKLLAVALGGYATGVTVNTIEQLDRNRFDLSKLDIGEAFSAGCWSAFGAVIGYGAGTIAAEMLGNFARGFATRLFKIITHDPAFLSTVSGVFAWIGKTIGTIGGSMFSSHLVNDATNNEQSAGEMFFDAIEGQILDFVEDTLIAPIKLKIKRISK